MKNTFFILSVLFIMVGFASSAYAEKPGTNLKPAQNRQLIKNTLEDYLGMSDEEMEALIEEFLEEMGEDDPDGDGIPNTVDSDDDNDGILDSEDADDDGDGILDIVEMLNEMIKQGLKQGNGTASQIIRNLK